jgi:hypothetical protein
MTLKDDDQSVVPFPRTTSQFDIAEIPAIQG